MAYVLGITRVDPIRHELLFERFINEGRTAYPDVDIDFTSERREEVIQYVYGRYGAEHTGMVCNLVTYRARSAVREVGYALGFPRPLVDRVAKALETYDSVMVRRDLEAEGGFAEFFGRPRGDCDGRDPGSDARRAASTDAMGQLNHARGALGRARRAWPAAGATPPDAEAPSAAVLVRVAAWAPRPASITARPRLADAGRAIARVNDGGRRGMQDAVRRDRCAAGPGLAQPPARARWRIAPSRTSASDQRAGGASRSAAGSGSAEDRYLGRRSADLGSRRQVGQVRARRRRGRSRRLAGERALDPEGAPTREQGAGAGWKAAAAVRPGRIRRHDAPGVAAPGRPAIDRRRRPAATRPAHRSSRPSTTAADRAARRRRPALGPRAGGDARGPQQLDHAAAAGEPGARAGRSPAPGSTVGLSDWERWLELCARIDGFPRHLSIHSGGMLVTAAPLIDIAPLERATMPDRVVVQFDKRDVETIKLIKLDLLGLGCSPRSTRRSSSSSTTARSASTSTGCPEDIPEVFAMLQAADTVGVFQVESRAQMQTLPKSRRETSTTSWSRSRSSGPARSRATRSTRTCAASRAWSR